MVQHTLEGLGRIDILVNNAGGSFRRPAEVYTQRMWDRQVGLNMTGPFLCSQAVFPSMKQQGGGAIVNIASGAATHGVFRAAEGTGQVTSKTTATVLDTFLPESEREQQPADKPEGDPEDEE